MQSPSLRRSVRKIPAGLILDQFVVDDEPVDVFRKEEAVAEFCVGTCITQKCYEIAFSAGVLGICGERTGE
jgi:hypothetical protein